MSDVGDGVLTCQLFFLPSRVARLVTVIGSLCWNLCHGQEAEVGE
jgi:hypothetical protein